MLSHSAFLILGDSTRCSAQTAQRALRIFGEWDLSLPRALVPLELERRFAWPAGAGLKTLNALIDLGILVALSHGRLSGGGMTLFLISPAMGWSPKSLADQWQREEMARDRAEVAGGEMAYPR